MPARRPPRRAYHSPRREEQARATQHTILAAARRLFSSRGYAKVTMNEVARASGVSPQTVYVAFGTKAAMLSELMRGVGMGSRSIALLDRARAATDAREQVRLVVALLRSMREDDAYVVALLWQAGTEDPDLLEAWREVNATRLERVTEVARSLAAKRALKEGLTATAAAEQLWALTSPELWRLLVTEHGWSVKRWEEWLRSTLVTVLLRG